MSAASEPPAHLSDAERLGSDYWLARRDHLFFASCMALIVTAMSFAIRGALIAPLGKQFHLDDAQIGLVLGTAFWGFTLAMVIGGPLCDVWGMRSLIVLAFIGHVVGIVMTIFAHDFWTLFFSTLAFGLGNGFVEAACNPLIATLFPDQKIKRLTLFHTWFPGGIAIGGFVALAITRSGLGGADHGWQFQMASMLLPMFIYGAMFMGRKFPATERAASGVATASMFRECLRGGFLLFVFCMLMTAATELVTGQWMPDIMTNMTGVDGLIFLILVNGLMAIGRACAGNFAHKVPPIGMLIGSAFFSSIGLFLLSTAHDATSGTIAAIVFAIGVCFFWPTMLGVVSQRFPKTGALGLAIMGGAGMLSVSAVLPLVGRAYDNATIAAAGGAPRLALLKLASAAPGAPDAVKAQLGAALATGSQAGLHVLLLMPVVALVIFVGVFMYDKARGGYKEEVLVQHQDEVVDDSNGTAVTASA